MDVKNFERKLIIVYNWIGFISIVGAMLSAILWIWVPWIGVRLFFSFVILFIGVLFLYVVLTTKGRNTTKRNV